MGSIKTLLLFDLYENSNLKGYCFEYEISSRSMVIDLKQLIGENDEFLEIKYFNE